MVLFMSEAITSAFYLASFFITGMFNYLITFIRNRTIVI